MLLNIEQTVSNYLATRYGESVRDEVALFFGEHFRLRHLFNLRTLLSQDSELPRDRKALSALAKSLAHADFGGVCYDGERHSRVLFVNGIMTPYSVALNQRDYIQSRVGQSVGLVYNPTESLIADLLECHQDRVGEPTALVKGLMLQIQYAVRSSPYPVTVIGYSQGAIAATRALTLLQDTLTPAQCRRLRYVTFGAGFKTNQLHDNIIQEHFANLRDPVVHLGLLQTATPHSGVIHTRDAQGHMLVADYLSPAAQAGFDLSKSPWFARMLQRQADTSQGVATTAEQVIEAVGEGAPGDVGTAA